MANTNFASVRKIENDNYLLEVMDVKTGVLQKSYVFSTLSIALETAHDINEICMKEDA